LDGRRRLWAKAVGWSSAVDTVDTWITYSLSTAAEVEGEFSGAQSEEDEGGNLARETNQQFVSDRLVRLVLIPIFGIE
jgi:hypothetical protein